MNQAVLDQTPSGLSPVQAPRSRWILFAALGLLVCVISALVIFPKVNTTEFSTDEPGWIASGYYYTTLAENGDLDWNKWFCQECHGFGRLNLHVGQYLYGIPMKIEKSGSGPEFFGFYDVDQSYEANARAGAVPSPAILKQARQIAAFFGVLCCLAIFAVGFWAYNPWVGVIAAALLVTNSVFLKIASQAMTDTFYNLFLMSVCLTLVFLVRVRAPRTTFVLVCLAGFLTALACSVKITGMLVGAGFFLGSMAWRYWRADTWRTRSGQKEIALAVVAFFAVCLAVVYLLNPFFWPSWNKAVWQEGRSFVHDVSTKKVVPWHRVDLENAAFAYPELRNLSHPVEFPLLFGRWSHELQRHLDRGWAGWDGPRLLVLHRTLFQQAVPFAWPSKSAVYVDIGALLLAALTFAGIYFLARSAMASPTAVVLLVTLVVNYLLIVLFMKLNWDRYYLPTTTSVDVIAGVGAYELVRRALGKRRLTS
jgi:4-amino-4-deoxy-L-arabinose transferase-like glycosyltransferase